MSSKINYTRNIHTKTPYPKRDKISLLPIDKTNIHSELDNVSKTIGKFNGEIEWRKMWTLEEAITRTETNHKLFILLEDNEPIGHVWFDGGFLYNAFVSKERTNGDSVWFIEECIFTIKEKKISLVVDKWNKRAIRFWEKLHFKKD